MRKLATIALLLLVAGCDDASVSVGVGGHWDTPRPPELLEVGVVDTYGVDSETLRVPLAKLEPYRNGGWFEVYWYADAYTDYRTSVWLSRSGMPGDINAELIGRFQCGPREFCYESGSLYCRYTSDFEIGCGYTTEAADRRLVSVAPLMDQVPEDLFLEVTTCDSHGEYCESGVVPVELY